MLEVGDLRECLMCEIEDLTRSGAPRAGVRSVFDAMREGRCSFDRGDLPFMDVAHASEIPFHGLLRPLNYTHRRGLDVEHEEA